MEKPPPRWIDTPAFNWTPETPLRAEPDFSPAPEPRFENPVLREPMPPAGASPTRDALNAVPRAAARAARPAPSLLPARLCVGLIQGAALYGLLAHRGDNAMVHASAMMVALFAPLLLLAGLGRMTLRPLLLWTGFAALLLAAAGAYHDWRTLVPDAGHPGLVLLALTVMFLFVGQSLAIAGAADYPALYRTAWRLAIRILLCGLFAGLCWALLSLASVFVRERYALPQMSEAILPLVALSAGLGAHLTGERLLGALHAGLMFVLNLAMPVLLLAAMATVTLAALGLWQASALFCAALAGALIVGINASYRDGTTWRGYAMRRMEFLGALLVGPLVLLAGIALAARVGQYGWTPNRIFGAAASLLLGGTALCYAGAALISLGGGGWMQRIEGANRAMAFAGLTLIAALASPIADPARLMVVSQTFRLDAARVSAETFDFTALRQKGLRFGRDALTAMAADKAHPTIARGAFAALTVNTGADRPAPTQIGANIQVHGPGRLPADLLARDWTGVTGAPPCLTSAAQSCDAFFADMDDDGTVEILLAYGTDASWWASVMKQGYRMTGNPGGWFVAGTLAAPPCPGSLAALRAGRFQAVSPSGNWRELLVNGVRLGVTRPSSGPPCPAT